MFDAVSVCALFNMINRLVHGAGITLDPRDLPTEEIEARKRKMGSPGSDPHGAEHSYVRLMQILNLESRPSKATS